MHYTNAKAMWDVRAQESFAQLERCLVVDSPAHYEGAVAEASEVTCILYVYCGCIHYVLHMCSFVWKSPQSR